MAVDLDHLVRTFLEYDPERGVLWRERALSSFASEPRGRDWNRRRAGEIAGRIKDGEGYRRIMLAGVYVYAHRAAWFLHHGHWPAEAIDHINGLRDDNRIVNLREATKEQNARNTKRHHTNTSGITGVSWNRRTNLWYAYIKVRGRSKSLGQFVDLAEAGEARKRADERYGFHKNHGRD